jgi:hypothetical protein
MEMKKAVCLVLVVSVLLFAITIPGYARDGGHFYGGGHFRGDSHFRGGSHFRGSIWIGPGWGEWGPWWWGPPYYYPYYYPYYSEPPVVIQQQPPAYVEPSPQPEEQYYWYFCQDPEGYYPYIKKCHKRWLKVIPPAPPEEE